MRTVAVRLAALLAFLLLVEGASASSYPPGRPAESAEFAITDGVPFDLDDIDLLGHLHRFRNRVSGPNVYDCIRNVTSEGPSMYRVMGTPTHDAFVEKYQAVFADLGIANALHEFSGGPQFVGAPAVRQGGVNILGAMAGQERDRVVLVIAHYDTRELALGGGALDNAAGLCTVLEIARSMHDYGGPWKASLIFGLLDGGEWENQGAWALAEDLALMAPLLGLGANPEVLAVQSFDMPGLNYPATNSWPQYGDPNTSDEYGALNVRTAPIHREVPWACTPSGCYEVLKDRSDFDEVVRRNVNYQFLIREVAYDMMWLPPEGIWIYDDGDAASDHAPWIAAGSPGMHVQGVLDHEYPYHHLPADTVFGIESLAGGAFQTGLDVESEIGALAAFYIAKTGGIGQYGDVLFYGDSPSPPGDYPSSPAPAGPSNPTVVWTDDLVRLLVGGLALATFVLAAASTRHRFK